jgi:hypothetical protein
LRIVHSNAESVAGDAWLRNFENGRAYFVPVSYTDITVGKPIDSKVLSKLSVFKVVPAEVTLPKAIGLDLINHHGSLFTAMTLKIRLPIAIKIQSASIDAMGYGLLPDRAPYPLALPLKFTWKTYID